MTSAAPPKKPTESEQTKTDADAVVTPEVSAEPEAATSDTPEDSGPPAEVASATDAASSNSAGTEGAALGDGDSDHGADPLHVRIDEVFRAQQAHRLAMAATSARERRERILRIASWVKRHKKEIRQAQYDDFQKPATEVDLTEIFPVLLEANHAAKDVKKWMKPRRVRRALALATASGKIYYEPRGTSLIISPWNYPLNLTLCPLISALAAGCTVILKPSEMTPNTSRLLAGMIEELFPEEEVALFEGAADVAMALQKKPFDHVFFTGSPAIGKLVMKAAAEHLTSVTLELGGKSPAIVDRSAHLTDAAKKIVWGKFVNQGQTCIAPDYVLVHSSVRDRLVHEMSDQISSYYGKTSDKRQSSPDLARIVNSRHFERLQKLLDQSVAAGGRVVYGGTCDPDDRWIEPTLLADVPVDAPAMQEEIFGPILPILEFDNLDEALSLVRSKEKPLALYLFSTSGHVTDRVLHETSAGGSCVNDVALHFLHPNLPFGGVNHSGHGASHGIFGFKAFSHERAVLRHHRLSALKMMAPPYGALQKLLTKLTVRFLS